jgi:hypothetical protein
MGTFFSTFASIRFESHDGHPQDTGGWSKDQGGAKVDSTSANTFQTRTANFLRLPGFFPRIHGHTKGGS